ncbi:cell division control protein 48 CDC48 [Mycobacteroides abscessus subsp. massiliense]|uniref:ATP-binding protein n=1 Tax=Mycobacteroides abscessus TaxID=36809 RepID=UPI0009A7B0E8|nr:ATP-binding protein [Mycobacteroides abscessus]SKG27104.1 cell division control protein 48 CDC48 [Mycobacteroides abscessus subsp. massiliense]SKH72688.1 cell division control protein 48 CDC48 [Mycobacteroides abscessus subsp. massiliense]SKJ17493.1 cell division control protein 48 CDC48 [Mycobacteroides abscessus subsp. massiliense]SKK55850.1 cell division control protein 48 CDC48 [Mycobacteroides abscessus subsp. massiliense]SKL60109.1 cell division control protein 48 CDC48 [Mycobacteroid
MADDAVITEMLAAVEASPDVLALRLRVIELLISSRRFAEALNHCTVALQQAPGDARALELLAACSAGLNSPAPEPVAASGGFDWSAAEDQVADIVQPAFVEEEPEPLGPNDVGALEKSDVRLADVGGMADVKRQLDLSLFGPLRNPELVKAFGVSARGGLLLYGPPGCGKTFLARAVAGELGANFYPVGIADVMHPIFGQSEQRMREIFEIARRNAPCVLFFDELDALGHRRSQLSGSSGLRPLVNQLLAELDPATESNEGLYVLGATNHPWDVDAALRRPGRFDRMILVALPDEEARIAIVKYHLRDRPLEGINLTSIAKRTEGRSGADLAHICNTATQFAMADSISTGQVRPVRMADIDTAIAQVGASAGGWFDTARNVVEFSNSDGTYDELAKYLRRRRSR